jgi:hypothetical protein
LCIFLGITVLLGQKAILRVGPIQWGWIIDFEEAVVEVGGAYEIMKCDSHTAIDILAGARYWHQDMSINLALTADLTDKDGLVLSKGIAIARGGSVDWVDPVVGGRVRT